MSDLPERMVHEAQNNQMIDQHYLPAGALLEEGAKEIERLRAENCRFRSALERYTPDILDEMEADDE